MTSMDIKEFWETAHRNNTLHALSGVPAEKAWEMLGVVELIRPGINVLDIGVGFGQNAKALVKAGCNVTCVDISNEALSRVDDIALTVNVDDFESITHRFNLAMGLNLIQHISGQGFENHLLSVLGVLKPGGIYAVETVWHADDFKNDKKTHNEQEQMNGWCWRTPDFVESLVIKNGGLVRHVLEHNENKKHNVWWCTLHISAV